MKRKWVLSCLVCALALVLLVTAALWENDVLYDDDSRHYLVVLPKDTGSFISQFKQGVEMGAQRAGDTVSFIAVDPDADMPAQILRLLRENAEISGVALPHYDDAYAAFLSDIPAVGIWMEHDAFSACIATDHIAQGEALAAGALSVCEDIVVVMENTPEQQKMLEGVVHIQKPRAVYTAVEDIQAQGAGIVCLSGTLAVAAAENDGYVWSVDPGDDRAHYLESGLMRGIIMEIPFAQGYMAVQALGGDTTGMLYSSSRMIDRETMLLAENAHIFFPLLQ